MTSRSFTLQPFPGTAPPFPLEIAGAMARRGHTLTVRYELRGELAAVALPQAAASPVRRHGLWEETCLEFFLAPADSPRYWEFNLSPAGDWNVYAFESYRQGMRQELAVAELPCTVARASASVVLSLKVNLAGFLPAGENLEAAISAVVKGRGGGITHWALAHPGPQPDFHRRGAFLIKL
jgi:hypothetical protein